MNNKISFNTKLFLESYQIEHTDMGQKATKNRIQVHCPFCVGSKNFHLGIHVTDAYANCWRCGPHSLLSTIKELLHTSWREAYQIVDEFADIGNVKIIHNVRKTNDKLVLPGLIEPLKDRHKKYIKERGYNPEDIEKTWNIQSVGPVGASAHRIYIPIYYRGMPVSYQCRSIIKRDDVVRYLTCAPEKEKVFHKSILYGLDYVQSDTILVVEGVTDVWRMGPGTVATFGIEYMKEQVFQLSKFKKVYIMFDSEPTAQKQASKLANELAFMKNCEPYIINIGNLAKDPGELKQPDADDIMLNVIRGTI